MSGYTRDDGSNEYQSVHALSLVSLNGPDDYEEFQTVAASSVMGPWSAYNTPWSAYNTRRTPHHSSLCSFPDEPTSLHAFDHVDQVAHHQDSFRDSFPPLETLGRHPNTDGLAYSRQSSPRNSSRPCHSTTATAAVVVTSDTSPSDINAAHEILSCTQCDQTFTGAYRTGNYARHVRRKHTRADLYECDAPDCFKVYQRQDARLKHMRSRHPELQFPPIQRRRHEAPTPQNLRRVRATSSPNQLLYPVDHKLVTTSASGDYLRVPTPHAGTRPSTPSDKYSLSQHLGSTFTDTYDSSLLSPHSPYHRRQASLPTNVFEDHLLSPLSSPGQASSQYDPDAWIDPALLNSIGMDSEDDAIYGEHPVDYFGNYTPY